MSQITSDESGKQPIVSVEEPQEKVEESQPEQYEEFYELPESIAKRNRIWSVLSLLSAILSVLLCPFYYVSLPLAALAIIFAVIMRRSLGFFEQMSVIGLIIGIAGIVFSACSLTLHLTGLWDMIFPVK